MTFSQESHNASHIIRDDSNMHKITEQILTNLEHKEIFPSDININIPRSIRPLVFILDQSFPSSILSLEE